jgi:CRP-like cAMP-binding protein
MRLPRPEQDILDILAGARLFSGLDSEALSGLLAIAKVENFEAGQVLYNQGDLAEVGYILARGRVELVENSFPGRSAIQLFTAGSLFSDNGFIKAWKYRRSCRTIEETTVLSFETGIFRTLLGQGDEAAMRIIDNLLDVFVHDLRDTNQKLDKIFSRPDRTLEQLKLLMQPTQGL